MREKIIAGNWKMNGTLAEARALVTELLAKLPTAEGVETVVAPPATALATVAELIKGSKIALAAQDMFWKEKGAYTGQISPAFLTEIGVKYVIIGHSEPRGRFGVAEPDFTPTVLAYFGASDEVVNRKAHAALKAGLIPIICVGETLAEREANTTDAVVSSQVTAALAGITAEQAAGLVFAYEPVWAIGTGKVCAGDEADRVCGVVRAAVGKLYGAEVAEKVRVQYGGSVKADNAKELLSMKNIDGALVGGASLKAADFVGIVTGAK